jgi:hypothetical protein
MNAGKTASVYIKMANACIYKGVLELSLALLSTLYSDLNSLYSSNSK